MRGGGPCWRTYVVVGALVPALLVLSWPEFVAPTCPPVPKIDSLPRVLFMELLSAVCRELLRSLSWKASPPRSPRSKSRPPFPNPRLPSLLVSHALPLKPRPSPPRPPRRALAPPSWGDRSVHLDFVLISSAKLVTGLRRSSGFGAEATRLCTASAMAAWAAAVAALPPPALPVGLSMAGRTDSSTRFVSYMSGQLSELSSRTC